MNLQEPSARGRILVMEQRDEKAIPIVSALVEAGHDVRRTAGGRDGVDMAANHRAEVVILGTSLPDIASPALCRLLRTDHRSADARILVLGQRPGPDALVEGLEGGGDDYLEPDVSLTELVVRVHAALRRDRDLRESSPLTGLPGNSRITTTVQRCIEQGTPFALIHCDLRNFKAYNDRYGFARGDEALLTLARITSETGGAVSGTPAIFGHLGGDDFALVCPPGTVAVVCEEIIERFDDSLPNLYDPADWEQGFIEVSNRKGEQCRYPPLSVALGVASSVHRSFGSASEAAAIATEMKQVAKLDGRSSWRLDQRLT